MDDGSIVDRSRKNFLDSELILLNDISKQYFKETEKKTIKIQPYRDIS
jgi:hypothetical protein